jgi:hypothetical protein
VRGGKRRKGRERKGSQEKGFSDSRLLKSETYFGVMQRRKGRRCKNNSQGDTLVTDRGVGQFRSPNSLVHLAGMAPQSIVSWCSCSSVSGRTVDAILFRRKQSHHFTWHHWGLTRRFEFGHGAGGCHAVCREDPPQLASHTPFPKVTKTMVPGFYLID